MLSCCPSKIESRAIIEEPKPFWPRTGQGQTISTYPGLEGLELTISTFPGFEGLELMVQGLGFSSSDRAVSSRACFSEDGRRSSHPPKESQNIKNHTKFTIVPKPEVKS